MSRDTRTRGIMNVIEQSAAFAKEKHDASGKPRKNTGEPYFVHPERVANRLMKLLEPSAENGKISRDDLANMIAAAYLHDVVEDCDVPLSEIEERFGKTIATYVDELTSDKKLIEKMMVDQHLKKYEAKQLYLTKEINKMSKQARLVKLADREDNVQDLHHVVTDKKEWVVDYSKETNYILDHLSFKLSPVEKILVASIRKTIRPYLGAQEP
jgi:guanosine-3',5'-bis(diphosphate) 3'-pyrophosphohydrolase